MMIRLAVRSLMTRPLRTAVLAGGFGIGVGAMAGLLGVGAVILEQARSPELAGGGDVLVGVAGDRGSHALRALAGPLRASEGIAVASPRAGGLFHVVRQQGGPLRVVARGGIPSLEQALGDPETGDQALWADGPQDDPWLNPDLEWILRESDRFHEHPAESRWQGSWAEWLYFNGTAGDTRFYLTFLVGEGEPGDRRPAGVRLQLETDEWKGSWWAEDMLDGTELLRSAPDLDIAGCSVRLDATGYRITLDFPGSNHRENDPRPLRGSLLIQGGIEGLIPPLQLYGAHGWVSGYVVPVSDGRLEGTLNVDGVIVPLQAGRGYHDHNWGYWAGVTWRWGQVAGAEGSFLYGRVIPPEDAADPDQMPPVLVFRGVDGERRFLRDVKIEEQGGAEGEAPQRILVRGSGPDAEIRMEFQVSGADRTRTSFLGDGRAPAMDLLQMRGVWTVRAKLGGEEFTMQETGSAETFRGSSTVGKGMMGGSEAPENGRSK